MHNHYIETLVSTGVVGLVLFVGMLALCALALWKNLHREDCDPLAPALAAALVFMGGHALVEVVFSFPFYLTVALGILGLICVCCGDTMSLKVEKEDVLGWITVGIDALLALFVVTLSFNLRASHIAERNTYGNPYKSLEAAAEMDLYEGMDYELSYVRLARGINQEKVEKNWPIYEQANRYAEKLGKISSNIIPIPAILAEYYFSTDQQEKAFAMLEKQVTDRAADSQAWNTVFQILETYSDGSDGYRTEIEKLYQQLLSWDEQNLGDLHLTEANQAYIDGVLKG